MSKFVGKGFRLPLLMLWALDELSIFHGFASVRIDDCTVEHIDFSRQVVALVVEDHRQAHCDRVNVGRSAPS